MLAAVAANCPPTHVYCPLWEFTPWQTTTAAHGVDPGVQDRTKILTPFVLAILSSCAVAKVVIAYSFTL
jgi:hypothetical protein